MGSRSKINLAYIAGFLDGDGSLMLQIKRRKDGNKKWRFMCTICFYQDSRHEESLYWIKNILGIGYISKRNDGMTELRINGFKQVRDILKDLIPFIKFKKDQAGALFKASDLLSRSSILSNKQLLELIKFILIIQNNNYVTKRKRTKEKLMTVLGLTP
ncbi:MAG: LAGLIDADG family homing endonuclease [Candidatus Yanofskybacteria bacterium]|nr:LAGLIDADG family homing endonuclease [Candidatus Yanofskybacteria bacterium]